DAQSHARDHRRELLLLLSVDEVADAESARDHADDETVHWNTFMSTATITPITMTAPMADPRMFECGRFRAHSSRSASVAWRNGPGSPQRGHFSCSRNRSPHLPQATSLSENWITMPPSRSDVIFISPC